MKKEDAVQLLQRIKEVSSQFDMLQQTLDTLRDDTLLELQGHKIWRAVDFSEIFTYIFPLRRLAEALRDPTRGVDGFIKEQIATTFLFEHVARVAPLVLLPPYAVELQDYLWMIRVQAGAEAARPTAAVAELQRLSAKISADQDVRRALDSQGASFTEADLNVLLSFIKAHFSDALGIYMIEERNASSLITALDEGRVRLLHDVLPDATPDGAAVLGSKDIPSWENALFSEREPYRRHANYLDAVAIEYVRYVNRMLGRRAERMVLVSRSEAMKTVLRQQHVADGGDQTPSSLIIRDIDDMTTKMIHRADTLSAVQERIRETQAALDALGDVGTDIDELIDLSRDESLTTLQRLERAAGVVTHALHSRANVLLAAAGTGNILPKRPTGDAARDYVGFLQQLFAVLPRMTDALTQEAEQMARTAVTVSTDMESLIRQEAVHALGLSRVSHLETKSVEGGVLVSGQFSRAYYSLTFTDPLVSAGVLGLLSAAHARGDLSGVWKELGKIRAQKRQNTEVSVLEALLHGIVGRYGESLASLAVAVGDQKGAIAAEACYFQSVIHRVLKGYPEAMAACQKAVGLRPQDPKYLKELGLLIWIDIHVAAAFRAEVTSSLDEAISVTEKAAALKHGDHVLDMLIWNNLTFYYLERYRERRDRQDLAAAEAAFGHLAAEPSGSWLEELFATRGFLRLAQAEAAGDSATREALLSGAEEDLNRALRIPKLEKFVFRIGQECLRAIRKLRTEPT